MKNATSTGEVLSYGQKDGNTNLHETRDIFRRIQIINKKSVDTRKRNTTFDLRNITGEEEMIHSWHHPGAMYNRYVKKQKESLNNVVLFILAAVFDVCLIPCLTRAEFELVSEALISGIFGDGVIVGDSLYLVDGRGFKVLNLHDGGIETVHQEAFPSLSTDLGLTDTYLLVTTSDSLLLVYSSPRRGDTQLVATYQNGRPIHSVAAGDDVAYIIGSTSHDGLHGSGYLEVLDFSSGPEPNVFCSLGLWGFFSDIVFFNNLLCISWLSDADGGVYFFDVTDPSAPVFVFEAWYWGPLGYYVDMKEDRTYIAGWKFEIVDVSQPPYQILASVELKSEAGDIEIHDSHAFVSGYGDTLYILNIEDEGKPKFVNTFPVPGLDYIKFHGEYACLWGRYSRSTLDVIDFSNLMAPKVIVDDYFPGQPFTVEIDRDRMLMFVGYRGNKIQAVDISNPLDPKPLGMVEVPSFWNNLACGENLLLVPCSNGLCIIDTSDPDSLFVAGNIFGVRVHAVGFKDDYVYLATMEEGLQVWSVETPMHPFFISRMGDFTGREIEIQENIVFIGADWEGISVDISDPSAPRILATWPLGSYSYDFSLSGNLLAVARGWKQGATIFNISDPSNPVPYTNIPLKREITDVELSGNDLLLVEYGDKIWAFDIFNPSSPLLTGILDTPGNPREAYLLDSLAVIVDLVSIQLYSYEKDTLCELKGDIDGSGEIDISDVVLCVDIIIGIRILAPCEFWSADMNDDGHVNAMDVVLLVRSILERPDHFTSGKATFERTDYE